MAFASTTASRAIGSTQTDLFVGVGHALRHREPRLAMIRWWGKFGLCLPLFSGCDGPQSALSDAGRGAGQIADLFYFMLVAATVVWILVVALGAYALVRPESGSPRKAAIYIIGGGVLFPTISLTALLAYGLSLLPEQVAAPPGGSLRVTVTGYQWWWRVHYPQGDVTIELANEIHLPVGAPVEFQLLSDDVIHSFWVPSLGGKVDMIPGRRTRLTLHPTRTGVFRGVCAEFCGTSHALMSFYVVVEPEDQFQDWLEQQSQPAAAPDSQLASRGAELFLRNGCGACHTIRGTEANGRLGPDLTHVGGRLSLGADAAPNDQAGLRQWIAHAGLLKPDVLMPHFNMLPAAEIEAMAAYLDGLK